MGDEHTLETRNQSGINGEIKVTRAQVRAIKKLCETEMHRREHQENKDDAHVYPLGGDNWADIDNLRTECKQWLVDNQ